jgi:hypothetical protein
VGNAAGGLIAGIQGEYDPVDLTLTNINSGSSTPLVRSDARADSGSPTSD